MKLHELAIKDQQLDELNIGKAVGTVGKGVGKAAGGVAKAVGAIAGGVAGLGSAFKKGWQAGKKTVAGDDEPAGDSSGSAAGGTGGTATPKPTAQGGAGGTGGTTSTGTAQGGGSSAGDTAQGSSGVGGTGGTTSTGTAQGGTGTATPKPAAQGGTAQGGTATPKPTAQGGAGGGASQGGGEENTDKVGALQARISKLDADSQKDIMQLLQKQAATAKPETKPQATNKPADQAATTTDQSGTTDNSTDQGTRGVSQPGKPTFTGVPEKPAPDTDQSSDQSGSKLAPGAFGKMAQDLTKPLAGADSETPGAALPQKSGGGRPQGGGRVAGQLSTDPRAVKRREQRAAKKAAGNAPSQAEIDADRERIMGPTSDSIIRKRPAIVEGFSLFRK